MKPTFIALALSLVLLMGCQLTQINPTPTPPTATPAPLPLNNVPAERLQRLSKSVNITRWFWYTEGSGENYFNNYMTDADLKLIREMGVLSVRLVISPTYFYQVENPSVLNPTMIGYLDNAIDRILAHDLAVIVDMHDQDKEAWETKRTYVDGFLVYWQQLAKRYANRDVNRVYFEMLNEPVFTANSTGWGKVQARWVNAMREVVPAHTLVVTGNEWGGISGLQKLTTLDDLNLVYSFHFYDPFEFTHQAATWAGPGLPNLKNLPYPTKKEACDKALADITDTDAKSMARNYCNSGWGKTRLREKFEDATAWSKKNKRPIWLGEFGVYCQAAPVRDRARLIQDVRELAEKNNVGWTIWGYDECFGLQRKLGADGKINLDETIVQALGLKTIP